MEVVYSIHGVPIRLTEERWWHILNNRPYMEPYRDTMLKSVENPTWVLRGYAGAQVAVLPVSRRQYLHTVYKEVSRDDGFIITAFVARDYNRGLIVWP